MSAGGKFAGVERQGRRAPGARLNAAVRSSTGRHSAQWIPAASAAAGPVGPPRIWLSLDERPVLFLALAPRGVVEDGVEIMVHEPYLAFWEHAWRHALVAAVHRVMTMLLLGAADQVWIAIPTWQQRWARYALGRRVPFTWLPVPSSVSPASLSSSDSADHSRYAGQDGVLIGHFGTYGPGVAELLQKLIPPSWRMPRPLAGSCGTGSVQFRHRFIVAYPELAERIHAIGHVPATDLAAYLSACDLLIQPYPDGVSSRRTSAMAGLSLGRAIVTTRGHLTEPLWDASKAVLLADVADPRGFVAHVERLLLDCGERQRLGDSGRACTAIA